MTSNFSFALLVIASFWLFLRHFGYFCVPRATQTIFVMTKPKNLYFCNSHNNFLVLKKNKKSPKKKLKKHQKLGRRKKSFGAYGGKIPPRTPYEIFLKKI